MTDAPAANPEKLVDSLLQTSFVWLLIRGILAVIFGVIMFLPAFGAAVLAVFVAITIGVWLLFDGVASIVIAIRQRKSGVRGWGWTLAGGVVSLLAGLVAVIFPAATGALVGLFVLWALAFGLILRGVLELGSRGSGWGTWFGILHVLFGIVLTVAIIWSPGSALLALVWIAGVYGIAFGGVMIFIAFQMRKLRKEAA